jgi:hypothetical protein
VMIIWMRRLRMWRRIRCLAKLRKRYPYMDWPDDPAMEMLVYGDVLEGRGGEVRDD